MRSNRVINVTGAVEWRLSVLFLCWASCLATAGFMSPRLCSVLCRVGGRCYSAFAHIQAVPQSHMQAFSQSQRPAVFQAHLGPQAVHFSQPSHKDVNFQARWRQESSRVRSQLRISAAAKPWTDKAHLACHVAAKKTGFDRSVSSFRPSSANSFQILSALDHLQPLLLRVPAESSLCRS